MTDSVTTEPRVVVGVDGSEESKLALRWGAQFAASTGASLEAVIAWELPITYGWSATPAPTYWNPMHDMEKVLVETVDEVFGPNRPPNLQLAVREGGAARVLLDESKSASMLVVGSRGRGGFVGLLLGSVSASVAEHATCPVLVVHRAAENRTSA